MTLAILTVCLASTLLAAWWQQVVNQRYLERQADVETATIVQNLSERLGEYRLGLLGARGAVVTMGTNQVTLERFRRYVNSRDHDAEFQGARGFGFIRRVMPDEVAGFLAAARAEGRPEFQIRQLQPSTGERWVIQYIEPEERNQAAVGLDIASEVNRRGAAESAARENRPVLTAPITLVQATGVPLQSFLLLLPVYRENQALNTPEQRMQATMGWTYAPLITEEILRPSAMLGRGFEMAFSDITDGSGGVVFYASPGYDERQDAPHIRHHVIRIYDRAWSLSFRSDRSFVATQHLTSAWWILMVGLGFTLLVSALTFLNARQRQRAEAVAQRENENRKLFELAVEASPNAMVLIDRHQRITLANRRTLEIFGYSAQEMRGMDISDLLPVRFRKDHPGLVGQFLKDPASRAMGGGRSFPALHQSGREVPVEIGLNPIGSGENMMVLASIVDLTTRRALEKELKDALNRTKLAVDAAGIGIWVWNLETGELFWDDRMADLFDLSPEERRQQLYYESWRSRVHPEDVDEVERVLHGHVAGTAIYDVVYRIFTQGNALRFIHAGGILERGIDGRAVRVVGICRDVTEEQLADQRQQKQNAELMAAKVAADQASLAKSQFVANMSHEIRTPMNAILGLAYLLDKQGLSPVAKDMISKIQSAGRSLLGIINDILDFSKIEARHLDIEHIPFRLSEVMDNLAGVMSTALGHKDLELSMSPVPADCEYLNGDALRLGQVLMNLASNAIKFTERGEVVVRVESLPCDKPVHRRVRFVVRDTGTGIPASNLALIFQPFHQGDSSTTRHYGGTGLGLSISRHLVHLMGGELAVDSREGEGSTFHFTLEFGASEAHRPSPLGLSGQRILVTDDHETAQTLIGDLVRSLGWEAKAVGTATDALNTLKSDPNWDVLLMDMHLPDMTGLEALDRIRTTWGDGNPPVSLLLTAFEREQVDQDPHAAQADAVLPKPLTASALINTVLAVRARRALNHPKGDADSTSEVNAQPRLVGLRLLVVDDVEMNREVAMEILRGEGAVVDFAVDGQDALVKLSARPLDFDIALVDIQMPRMDGYETTQRIRADGRLKSLKVVALTAGALRPQVRAALDAGMDAFIPKPFDVDLLVNTLLNLVGRSSAVAPEALHEAAPARSSSPIQAQASRPLVDREDALTKWRDVRKWHLQLHKFSGEYDSVTQRVSLLLTQGEELEAMRVLHKLRGSAASLSLRRLSSLAGDLEEGMRAGGLSGTELSAALRDLLQAEQQTWDALRAETGIQPADPEADSPPPALPRNDWLAARAALLKALHDAQAAAARLALNGLAGQVEPQELELMEEFLITEDFEQAIERAQRWSGPA